MQIKPNSSEFYKVLNKLDPSPVYEDAFYGHTTGWSVYPGFHTFVIENCNDGSCQVWTLDNKHYPAIKPHFTITEYDI